MVAEAQERLELEVDGKVGTGTLAAFGIKLPTFDAIAQLPGRAGATSNRGLRTAPVVSRRAS